jgi:hypothetical protein
MSAPSTADFELTYPHLHESNLVCPSLPLSGQCLEALYFTYPHYHESKLACPSLPLSGQCLETLYFAIFVNTERTATTIRLTQSAWVSMTVNNSLTHSRGVWIEMYRIYASWLRLLDFICSPLGEQLSVNQNRPQSLPITSLHCCWYDWRAVEHQNKSSFYTWSQCIRSLKTIKKPFKNI